MPGKLRSFAVLCLCAIPSLLAQTDRGVITGTVKGARGAVVPGAQVTAIQPGTNTISMQVKFSHRYSAGLTVQASYVLSKLPAGFQPASWFGTQPTTQLGDAARYNPKPGSPKRRSEQSERGRE